jgi:2,4-dienoyl-CoA reductase-like NADH-dependent reductase (Old Yellow Enzyme family)
MIKLGGRDYLQPGDRLVWGRSRGGTPKSDNTDSSDKEAGLTIEEGAEAARVLENEGISLIEISCGFIGTSSYKIHVGITSPEQEAYFLQDARVIRQKTSRPLGLVAGLRSIPVMEKIVSSGIVDCIAICRPLIREPGLIKRWKNGDTRPAECISCGGCFNPDENGRMHIYCKQVKKD